MRLSIILTLSTAIYFAASSIHAVPIPSCAGDRGNCKSSSSASVLSQDTGKANLGAVAGQGTGPKLKASLRRRTMNNKRDKQPATGPLSGKLEGAGTPISGIIAPVSGKTAGTATGVEGVVVAVNGALPATDAQTLDPKTTAAKIVADGSAAAQGVEGAANILKQGGGAQGAQQGKGQG